MSYETILYEKKERLDPYTKRSILKRTTANNRINSDWQFRCALLPAGYAERSAVDFPLDKAYAMTYHKDVQNQIPRGHHANLNSN